MKNPDTTECSAGGAIQIKIKGGSHAEMPPHSRRNLCVMAGRPGSFRSAKMAATTLRHWRAVCQPWCGMSQAGCWGGRHILQSSG